MTAQHVSTELVNLRFHSGGYCSQFEYFTGVRSSKRRHFHAVFISFVHPAHGLCLIDTGYGPAIYDLASKWPALILQYLIPIPSRQAFAEPGYLVRQGIDQSKVRKVFLSHFHSDHIGGSRLFPNSQFVTRADVYSHLISLQSRHQLRHGFVPALLPDDFATRLVEIPLSEFSHAQGSGFGFPAHDFWGDGSLILIDLPGHAMGHTGYLLRTTEGPILYVVDAFWDRRTYDSGKKLPFVSRGLHQSYIMYEETLSKLRSLVLQTGQDPIACHCPLTERRIQWID